MEEVANIFLKHNEPNKVEYAKKYLSDEEKIIELKINLTEFRSSKSKSRNIPENYIFSDNELQIILEKMPKTIDELKLILPDIKVKYHGDEIIAIINEIY